MPTFRLGDEGPQVHDIHERLTALGMEISKDERRSKRFDPSTDRAVREFQRRRRLPVDGIVGQDTWTQLVEAGYRLGDRALYLRSPMFRGDDVLELQRKLNALGFDAGKQDGLLGSGTAGAIREFQRNVGHTVDGIAGPDTVATLERMRPLDSGPGRAEVREREQLRAMDVSIEGQLVAIDPGRRAPTEPVAGRTSDGAYTIATAIARELAACGAKPEVLRGQTEDPEPSERAAAANELGAAVCISLQIPATEAGSHGPSCSFFGSATSHSPAGMMLATVILDELETELGQRGRLQRLTGAMLRETRMPAVQIEPFWHPEEAEALRQETVELIARAIVAGVRRFFEGERTGR